MASKAFLMAMAVFAAIFAQSMADVFFVGDERGWNFGVDFQAWAAGKQFRVGDFLVFRYPPGLHSVVKVNGTDFQSCSVPLGAPRLTTGNDGIRLLTPGKKWYISSVGADCHLAGMKLVINVLPEGGAQAPAPAPVSPATPKVISGIFRKLIAGLGH